ncbi:glycosyltransferase [Thermohalobacter berrensis]|uniref:Phospho-N-acetylmuramoyl-pentapeptide-transferase n=1 Tax=Thermohalobacter berrensis TaxID=99594 RepID=A0A419TAQ7_9FIRM|nr:glycosyltransferase [Thermohalobacter berrensis]RKD34555.1 phospho-N-acetylmuramoyl-pentapeptide-transferase [Thermohalobacter berrensis]
MSENILCLMIGMVFTYITIKKFYIMLKDNNCVAKNFENKKIPIGMGLVFVFNQTIITILLSIILKKNLIITFLYVITILFMGLIGFIDDIIGEKYIKGFKGHITYLLKGKLTTGGLKAITGFICATFVSILISKSFFDIGINILIIGLFTNIINLFDLRPGRASKAYILIMLSLLILSKYHFWDYILYITLGIILVYLPLDIKGKTMMGDIGSNTLGIGLGVFSVLSLSFKTKIFYLILLLTLHIISEVYSFTNIIKKNKLLNYLDNLGR